MPERIIIEDLQIDDSNHPGDYLVRHTSPSREVFRKKIALSRQMAATIAPGNAIQRDPCFYSKDLLFCRLPGKY
jgi:hypothetical protein